MSLTSLLQGVHYFVDISPYIHSPFFPGPFMNTYFPSVFSKNFQIY